MERRCWHISPCSASAPAGRLATPSRASSATGRRLPSRSSPWPCTGPPPSGSSARRAPRARSCCGGWPAAPCWRPSPGSTTSSSLAPVELGLHGRRAAPGSYLWFLVGASSEIDAYRGDQARLAVVEEHRRMARELHDGLVQELSFIRRRRRPPPVAWRSPAPGMAEHLAAAADRALRESRRAVDALPGDMPESLADALRTAARRRRRAGGHGRVADRARSRRTCRATSAMGCPSPAGGDLERGARRKGHVGRHPGGAPRGRRLRRRRRQWVRRRGGAHRRLRPAQHV